MESRLEETLDQLLPPSPFTEAARYALLGGGKRIRPRLVLYAVEMVRGESERALIPAAALEMVHTYSLIHDDLPCMDDDDFRRGKPSLHRAFDEASAVLAGDLLLTHAFHVLTTAPELSDSQKIALVGALAEASGYRGMVGGQLLDLAQSKEIERLHALKTGALFVCAMRFAASIAEVESAPLIAFGERFGLLFQAVDDLLDGDFLEGKERAEERAQHLFEETLAALAALPYESALLRSLVVECVPDRIGCGVHP